MIINEFYSEAFKGYEVPDNLKLASMSICNRYDIKGICDPMYIANVIAKETGIGDGRGDFNEVDATNVNVTEIAERLRFAYSSNVPNSKGVEEILVRTL